MDYENLTSEQKKKLHNGCFYESIKFICIFLLVAVFLVSIPLLGTYVVLFFTVLGAYVAAIWIVGFIYPKQPLLELRKELEEK